MRIKRPFLDRVQDRIWSEMTRNYSIKTAFYADDGKFIRGSITSAMDWPKACAALVNGTITSDRFRRLDAVMEVVETLAPSDGRHHAELILEASGDHFFTNQSIRRLDLWGNPFKWPSFLLKTPRPFAPTTLRYISHALWLRNKEYTHEKAHVVEIGVGYGGLSAVNHVVSGTITTLVDLPEVEQAALCMLEETGLRQSACLSSNKQAATPVDCVVSNYAFSELSSALQDHFIKIYMAKARHGMILSNASVFASSIGGKSDGQIVKDLHSVGINAEITSNHPLLSPSDKVHGSTLIHW